VHKDGRNVEVSLSVSPIRSVSGEIIGASKTARDITESNRTLRALTQEVEERRRIFETSHDLILVTDPAGNFIQVSPSAITILGYAPAEMIGHSATEFIHPDDLPAALDRLRRRMAGESGVYPAEVRYRRLDGTILPAEVIATPITFGATVPSGFKFKSGVTQETIDELTSRMNDRVEDRIENAPGWEAICRSTQAAQPMRNTSERPNGAAETIARL